VAAADVDDDGDLDLLTANAIGTVSVRLNDGSGSFSGSQEVPVGDAFSLAVGDVDGDGDLDFITANRVANSVSVRLNDGTGSFSGTQEVAVGNLPMAVVLGDVDGDGDLDLVTANGSSYQVPGTTASVRLNNGSGVFGGGQTVAVDNRPGGLALGDIDADGDLDLLVATAGNVASVRLNNGAGTFSGTQAVGVGSGASGITLGDVDGDNDLDLLTANVTGGAVSVRLNNGSGTFGGTQEVSAGTYPVGVTLGDVDGDGDLDMLVANSGGLSPGSVSVRLNNGTGTFSGTTDLAMNANPNSAVLADVDADGDLDMVVANYVSGSAGRVSVRLNSPVVPTITGFAPTSGVAGTAVTLSGTGLSRASAVVVNGVAASFSAISSTSLTFVVPAGGSAGQLVALTTTPGGTTTSSAFTVRLRVAGTSPAANARTAPRTASAVALTFTEPVALASAAPTPTTGLRVYSSQVGGSKAGTVSSSGTTLSYSSSLAAPRSDFMPGEVVSVSVPASIQSVGGLPVERRVYQFTTAVGGTGNGNFLPGSDPALASFPNDVAVGDVDGDGDLDMLAACGAISATGTVSVLFNNGSGTYLPASTVIVGPRPVSITLADVDGDGDLDFLTANALARVGLSLNNGTGTFSPPQDLPAVNTGGPVSEVVANDIDGDGDLDVVVVHTGGTGPGTVHVYLNDGLGTFTDYQTLTLGAFNGSRSLVLGDLDLDGDLDMLVANQLTAGTVSIRTNDGTGWFSGSQEVSVAANPSTLAVADVDGDGDLDLLVATVSGSPGTVSIRLNDGSGVFAGSQEVPVGSNPYGLAVGDVDADGDLDFVAANYGGNGPGTVSVRLNNGTGLFGGTWTVSVGPNPQSVTLGDVDGDGDLDLITANNNLSGTASVRLNQSGLPTAVSPAAAAGVTLSPNPAHSAVVLTGALAQAPVHLLDVLGRTVLTTATDASGTARFSLPAGLPAGVYLVRGGGIAARLAVE
jgi:hypothetical protein